MSTPQPPAPNERAKEPAAEIGIYVSAAMAIIGVLVTFGIGIDEVQGKAIVGAVAALATLAPIVSALWTRRRVYSPATVAQLVHGPRAARLAQFAPLLSRKAKYTAVILAAFALALGVEVWFAVDADGDTPPLTDLIVSNIPRELSVGAIGGLACWLAIHLWERYDRRKALGSS